MTNYFQSQSRKVEEKINHDAENMVRFYGPPSSCKELGMLGYTLNGYYFVENEIPNKINNKEGVEIELIYCRFQLPPGTEGMMNNHTQSTIKYNNGFISIILYSENGGTSRICQDCQQITFKKYTF